VDGPPGSTFFTSEVLTQMALHRYSALTIAPISTEYAMALPRYQPLSCQRFMAGSGAKADTMRCRLAGENRQSGHDEL
jgi:hypothetical protein